jgi:hypothetical protein
MGVDKAGTLRRLKALRREVIDPTIAAAHGRIVKTMGDGLLVEFPSPLRAGACAVRIQRAMLGRARLVYACGASWIRCGLIAVHQSILLVGASDVRDRVPRHVWHRSGDPDLRDHLRPAGVMRDPLAAKKPAAANLSGRMLRRHAAPRPRAARRNAYGRLVLLCHKIFYVLDFARLFRRSSKRETQISQCVTGFVAQSY